MEVNLGWPDTFIRVWVPDTWVGWKYCFQHPKSFIIGVYGFRRFIEQRDAILEQRSEITHLREKLRAANEKMRELGMQLSAAKRK